MRRLATFALLSVVAAAVIAAVVVQELGNRSQHVPSARFDVIFDDARGLIKTQVVKIAGAKAGKIVDVVVTPDYKARVEAEVESQFMPFRANAMCTIRPEGLIAENYLECDPGTPPAPVLRGRDGRPPTVPVSNTTEPVSLLDLFNIFNLPTRERFTVLVNELGIGVASRGQDLNDIVRRANPALGLARQAIAILTRQRAELATIVDATNRITADGAGHTGAIQDFITRAAAATSITAAHRDHLGLAVQRLPRLLAVAQPALQQLDAVATGGTPLVQQLHAAVPSLNRVASDLGPFVAAAGPGLARLRTVLKGGIPAIRAVTPVVRAIRSYTDRSLSQTKLTGRLFTSLQQAGFLENFLGIIYYVGAALSRYDATSHLLDVTLDNVNNGACLNYATTFVPGCGANFGNNAPAAAADGNGASPSAAADGRGGSPPAARSRPGASAAPASGSSGSSAAKSSAQNLQNLAAYLLR